MSLILKFIDLPQFEYFEKSDTVKDIQNLLLEMGYSVGASDADGIYGNDTKKAIAEFEAIGKIKSTGSVGLKVIAALKESEVNTMGYTPLSWEKLNPNRKLWSDFVFNKIDDLFDSSFVNCTDIQRFKSNYNLLTRTQKINVWGEIVSAICKFESGWNPTSRYPESNFSNLDSVTGKPVVSEGLFQLSYQDKKSYNGRLNGYVCQFDWAKDETLFNINPKDPKISILDPYKNLEFGIHLLAYQIRRKQKIALTKKDGGYYWAVIIDDGKYSKVNDIIAIVESLKI